MYHVGKLSETPATEGVYEGHCDGYTRVSLVDQAAGSLHQTLAVSLLEPGGSLQKHLHAFEEGLYLLEGQLALDVAGAQEDLQADDFVFIEKGVPHALANQSSAPTRWLEVNAPRQGADLEDTVFLNGGGEGADVDLPYRRGRFDESQLPPPSDTIGLAGFGAANVGGASLSMLIDSNFGASQFNLFVVEYGLGGFITEHDHPFEEAFFFLDGEIEAVLEGETYTVHAGEYCWSSVGSMHTFNNRSDKPVRWLETQVPQPPARHQARFRNDWDRLTGTTA